MMRKVILTLIIITSIKSIFAKTQIVRENHLLFRLIGNLPNDWFLNDPQDNRHLMGVNYFLPNHLSPQQKTIIAVIDSGIDINHESLKESIWVNQNEIPNNGIDDDKNGYIDDIVGWNFLGSNEGSITYEIKNDKFIKAKNEKFDQQITYDSLEITRRLKKLLRERPESSETIELKKIIDIKQKRAKKLKEEYTQDLIIFEKAFNVLEIEGSFEDLSLADLKNISDEDRIKTLAKKTLKDFLLTNRNYSYLQEQINLYYIQEKFHYNINLNQRQVMIHNLLSESSSLNYGNNNVIGFNSDHGTQVASLIVGSKKLSHDRNLGIAKNNVQIMPIRAIPNGDERDADIVAAIKYAVDNGAKIINMSFGKYLSPNNIEVSKALAYAESKNVIIVMAAGNDYLNLDEKPSYPFPFINNKKLTNTITVGSTSPLRDENIISNFSNIGSIVDLLAPGETILTAVTGNKYELASGTSLSAPLVSAALGLALSYDPLLDMNDLIHTLKISGTDLSGMEVYHPSIGRVLVDDLLPNPKILDIRNFLINVLQLNQLAMHEEVQ